jgi:hypothetical protein
MDDKYKMTEEEGAYWDDYYTKNTIMPKSAQNRILTGEGPVAQMALTSRIPGNLDIDAAEYVRTQAASAVIRRKLAKSA